MINWVYEEKEKNVFEQRRIPPILVHEYNGCIKSNNQSAEGTAVGPYDKGRKNEFVYRT
jgi:hypothetical protein